MDEPRANLAASVRQKLLNEARRNKRDFNVVLVAFGLERLIYRLAISQYKTRFVLKGGVLVALWTKEHARFTRDIDFLSFGPSDEEALLKIFREILAIDAKDGLIFNTTTLNAARIRENQIYDGIRLNTNAKLGTARIPVKVDIGFGDALPAPEFEIEYPSMLDFPAPSIRAYSPATVMAEKFQAVIALGMVNSRMKDYYDLWALPQSQEVSADDLYQAVRMTFSRRETAIPAARPEGLSEAFAHNAAKQSQWDAYAESIQLDGVSLADVVEVVWNTFEPICQMPNG